MRKFYIIHFIISICWAKGAEKGDCEKYCEKKDENSCKIKNLDFLQSATDLPGLREYFKLFSKSSCMNIGEWTSYQEHCKSCEIREGKCQMNGYALAYGMEVLIFFSQDKVHVTSSFNFKSFKDAIDDLCNDEEKKEKYLELTKVVTGKDADEAALQKICDAENNIVSEKKNFIKKSKKIKRKSSHSEKSHSIKKKSKRNIFDDDKLALNRKGKNK